MDEFVDHLGEEKDDLVDNDDDPNPCPKISVSQEKFEEWCSPWKKTLVINVLGKKISFKAIENKVHRDWVKSGAVRIIDIPNDYFLVQFLAEEDYWHALYEGPWMIADHYIVVQRWHLFFNITDSKIRKVAAWIRIK
uniref:DUF4283 domain-containing protein n=1 Tax=Cajanus cajan TaxID=3821 RepID=A0A151RTS1_CAJCA|nr:hypothetical protein KK1_032500 [Cajanus cajan]